MNHNCATHYAHTTVTFTVQWLVLSAFFASETDLSHASDYKYFRLCDAIVITSSIATKSLSFTAGVRSVLRRYTINYARGPTILFNSNHARSAGHVYRTGFVSNIFLSSFGRYPLATGIPRVSQITPCYTLRTTQIHYIVHTFVL